MTTKSLSPTRMIGTTGLKNIGGQVREEWANALKTWYKEAKIYGEMRDDAIIGTLLDVLKLPLLSAPFDIQPKTDDQSDIEAADFLQENIDNMVSQSWNSYIQDALEILDYGFAIGEIVLEKRTDGKLWLKSIEPRGQETLYQWEFDGDVATAFQQQDPDTGQILTIPLEKCVHITLGGRKGNPQGKAILRSVFRPWRFLRSLEDIEAIGAERDVGGMPVAKLPENGILTDADRTALENALKALRQDENSYLILPGGIEVTPYGGGTKAYDIGAIIERKKKEILMRVFAQFLMLGMDKVGTQSLVQGSQDFFSLALKSVQNRIVGALNQQLVPYIFSRNPSFSGLTDYPEIIWQPAGNVDYKTLMDSYNAGVTSGLITPIREDENEFRNMMGLTELPEGEGEGIRAPIEQPPLFPKI